LISNLFYLGIALLSKQKTFTAKMLMIVGKKVIEAFPTRDIAEQQSNRNLIKNCILRGFDTNEQVLYLSIANLKGKKAEANSELDKARMKARSIKNRLDYLFKQILNEIYGDVSGLIVEAELSTERK